MLGCDFFSGAPRSVSKSVQVGVDHLGFTVCGLGFVVSNRKVGNIIDSKMPKMGGDRLVLREGTCI